MRKKICFFMLLAALCLLCGCNIRTVTEMYSLPKRSEAQQELQAAIDNVTVNMEYCAPLTGDNRQTVQMADLNGDGIQEYLLFAKDNSEHPLKILIFGREDSDFFLLDTIEGGGTEYDLVEYIQLDDGGLELVVGRQISDQLVRSVSVYSFSDNQARQLLSTKYTKFLTCDLDQDQLGEIMIIRPGQSDTDNGVAELYRMVNGAMEKTNDAPVSGPADKLRRVITGKLHDGPNAVFVATAVGESAIITDVYTLVDGRFTNVSLSNDSETSVQTLRNYYIYAADMDDDGTVELPSLIRMTPVFPESTAEKQYLIRWYAMTLDGDEVDKMYTFHNYLGGWYIELGPNWASRISVVQDGEAYAFYLWDEARSAAEKVFTVYALTGHDREVKAVEDNRFVLHKTESVIYAARMEVASGLLEISREDLIVSFNLIRQDWKTGEM